MKSASVAIFLTCFIGFDIALISGFNFGWPFRGNDNLELTQDKKTCDIAEVKNLDTCFNLDNKEFSPSQREVTIGSICVQSLCNVYHHVTCEVGGKWKGLINDDDETNCENDLYKSTLHGEVKLRKKRWGRFRFRFRAPRLPRVPLPRIRLPRVGLPRVRLLPRIPSPRFRFRGIRWPLRLPIRLPLNLPIFPICWFKTFLCNKPPRYTNCPPSDLKSTYVADEGKTTVAVSWSRPRSTDNDWNLLSLKTFRSDKQNYGLSPGSQFPAARGSGRRHDIVYTVTDLQDLSGSCHFHFYTKYLGCNALTTPQNGKYACTNGNLATSQCTLTCNAGYEIVGVNNSVCLNNEQWSSSPSCKRVSCIDSKPDDGYVECPTNYQYSYGDDCLFLCNSGFGFTGTSHKTTCQEDRTWSGLTNQPICKDNVKPSLTCESPQVFYAARGTTSANVVWKVPTATDDSAEQPSVTQVSATPTQGDTLPTGIYKVEYQASDDAGNNDTCHIDIDVKVIKCSNSPTDELTNSTLMTYDCSTTAFNYGTNCTLSCDMGMPLIGPSTMTCEQTNNIGVWQLEGGQKPYCDYITCEVPVAPSNGRNTACSNGHIYQSECTFDCYDGYEMVGNAVVTCQSSATWTAIPTCQKVTCQPPGSIANGNIICDDPALSYNEDCVFACDDGFALSAPGDVVKMTCQASKTWSVDISQVQCTDNTAPVLSCQSPQIFYADRGSTTTSVTWQIPTVTDNFDSTPTLTKLSGPNMAAILDEGAHQVKYQSSDDTGNESPTCTINIEVKVIKCSTGPIGTLPNPYLIKHNCDDTSVYKYGDSCTLDCDLNMPLIGADIMTCERVGTSDTATWDFGTGTEPYCNYIECNTATAPSNGRLVSCTKSSRYESVCTFKCDEGYEMTGDSSIECQESAEWTVSPVCNRVTCPAPASLLNGRLECSDSLYSFESDCDFVCNNGFAFVGLSNSMECQSDKTWSTSVDQVQCKDSSPPVISCETPQIFYADRSSLSTSITWIEPTATDNTDLTPAIVKMSGPVQGSSLDEGKHYATYKASDDNDNSSPVSICTIQLELNVIRCSSGPTDVLNNASLITHNCTSLDYIYGITCVLGCEFNMPLIGSNIMSCETVDGTSGSWDWGSGDQPYCNFIKCSTPTPPSNGRLVSCTNDALYRSICSFKCDEGYEMTGDSSIECQESAEWTVSPVCNRVTCPEPASLLNGVVECSDPLYSFESDCDFVCNDGFAFVGSSTQTTCQADRSWSIHVEQVQCTDSSSPVISCQTPQIFYADRESSSTSVTWIEPSATDNTDLTPNITQTSGPLAGSLLPEGLHYVSYTASDENGNVSPLSRCTIQLEVKVITCNSGPTDVLDIASLMTHNCTSSVFFYGITCGLDCELDMPLSGSSIMTCERDGTSGIWDWGTGAQPKCNYIDCITPSTPSNGALVSCTRSNLYQSVCTFTCNAGYEIDGSTSIECQDSAQWTASPVCTKVQCTEPPALSNGKVICGDPNYFFESDCELICNEGFSITDSAITCQADQSWSINVDQVQCTDSSSPVISCQTPQIFYADRSSSTTSVTWIEPTATDNTDLTPDIVKTTGPVQGDVLLVGSHSVSYEASDDYGNTSPLSRCTIQLEVKEISCNSGPTDVLDNKSLMTHNCTSSVFSYGITCGLDCELDMPLSGSNIMTCERDGTSGIWDYGTGDQPYCQYLVCSNPIAPTNGQLDTCSNSYLYQSVCTFSCNEGFVMVGDTSATCLDTQRWSTIPSCQRVVCPTPGTLVNGQLTCDSDMYGYNDDCQLECNDGFQLNSPGDVSEMTCQSDGSWTLDLQIVTCTDSSPPEISCEEDQVFYADRGVTSTLVNWVEPTATDNVDASVTIVKLSGQDNNVLLDEGVYVINYKVTDSAGNSSPLLSECSINVEVKVIVCASGPTDALDNSSFMKHTCTGSSQFYYGRTCYLSCEENIVLHGSNEMTCELDETTNTGFWNWSSSEQPQCKLAECPLLDAPNNGALTKDTVNFQPANIMSCQDGFIVPSISDSTAHIAFTGYLYCKDYGTWYPLPKFPDCVEFLNKPSTEYDSICPSDTTCTTQNLEVICGSTSRKRRSSDSVIQKRDDNSEFIIATWETSRERRSSDSVIQKRHNSEFIIATWETSRERRSSDSVIQKRDDNSEFIIATWETAIKFKTNTLDLDSYTLNADTLNSLANATKNMVIGGDFDIAGFILKADSYQQSTRPSFGCDPGQIREVFDCKPCPKGAYVNTASQTCALCPKGEYSDTVGASGCTKCPTGYSTLDIGSKHNSSCKKQCEPGSYSTTTLEPCIACPTGTYQGLLAQTYCDTCPTNQITHATHSTSRDSCVNFDILVNQVVAKRNLANFSMEDSNILSLVFWSKYRSINATDFTITIQDSSANTLGIIISDTIKAVVDMGNIRDSSRALSNQKWTRIVATFNMDSNLFSLFVDGESLMSETLVQQNWNFSDARLFIENRNLNGVHLSGIKLVGRAFTAEELDDLGNTCSANISDTLLTMDDLKDIFTSDIVAVTPSECDAIDECVESHCVTGTCRNDVDSFTCICQDGMTGELCDVPPDYCENNECVNGGICSVTSTSYICTCDEGFSGPFCEIAPINGGWTEWSDLGECSKPCNNGTQTRSRSCSNPEPGFMGKDCEGKIEEVKECNTDPCQECTDLKRKYGTIVNCYNHTNEDGQIRVCNISCTMGKILANGQAAYPGYSCVYGTGIWEPTDKLPECVDARTSTTLSFLTSAAYELRIPEIDQDAVASTVIDRLTPALECIEAGSCTVSADFGNSKRKKRATGDTMTLVITMTFDETNSTGFADYFENNGTVSNDTAIYQLVEAVESIEHMTEFIESNMELYDVVVNGNEYAVDNETASFGTAVNCEEGSVVTYNFCAKCPAGTMSDGESCVSCPTGTYQPDTGQGKCYDCPSDYTTLTYASIDIADCSIFIEAEPATVGQTPQQQTDEDTGSNVALIVSCTSAAVVVLALGLFVGFVVWKKVIRKRARDNTRSASFASLTMVRPAIVNPLYDTNAPPVLRSTKHTEISSFGASAQDDLWTMKH